MTHLPLDYTRCMGLGCPDQLRLNCARHRDLPENTVLSWVRTMLIDGVPGCDGLIPWEVKT